MWSASYNFWLSRYTEGWERLVVTLIIWQSFIFQNKSSGGQGPQLRYRLPWDLFCWSCLLDLFSLAFILYILFWELLRAFPRDYFQTFLYPPWTPVPTPLDGFYRGDSKAAQSFDAVGQTVLLMSLCFSQHVCAQLALVPQGISHWPGGDNCTFLQQRTQGEPVTQQLWCSCTCRTAVSKESL